MDSRTRKVSALRKALDHSNLDTRTEDTSIAHLEAVLETKFKDLTKGRGAPWRRDNKAGEAALELLMQVCGVSTQWMDQPGVPSGSPVRVPYFRSSSRRSSLAKDHNHAPSGGNTAMATPTSNAPSRNPEHLPTAAVNHLAHIAALASLDARLAQIDNTQDTEKDEDAPSSIVTNVTFDVETNDFENRLQALEGELEMIDQDVSGKLVEVVEKWEDYVSIDGGSERYRFGGGEVPQAVPEPIFEVRSEILHQLLRNLTKLPRRQRIAHGSSTPSGSLPLFLFKRRSLPFSKRYNHNAQLHRESQRRTL